MLLLMQYFVVAGIVAVFYMFKFVGYELIVLAILIDGYYGAFYSVPYLSIMTALAVFIVSIIKPYLLYTERNEMVS